MSIGSQNLRPYVLIPFGVGLALFLVVGILGFYKHTQGRLDEEIQSNLASVEQMLRRELDKDADLMSGLLDFLKADKRLQDAWLARDREELLRVAAPLFEDIGERYRVTRFCFHDLDRVNFLRVHDPLEHGNVVNRLTVTGAASRGEVAYGIELEKCRTFTLRVVHSWEIDGERVGYIELGEEIKHITEPVA